MRGFLLGGLLVFFAAAGAAALGFYWGRAFHVGIKRHAHVQRGQLFPPGEFRGGGIWLVWEAQCRIQADLQDLYNMACGDPGGGQVNISAQFVAEKSLDALVWLAMAGEINRLAVAEFEKQTQ